MHWNFSFWKKETDSASYIYQRCETFITLSFHLISVTPSDPLAGAKELEKFLIIKDLFLTKIDVLERVYHFFYKRAIHLWRQTDRKKKLTEKWPPNTCIHIVRNREPTPLYSGFRTSTLSHPLPWHSSTQNIFFV